MGIWPEERKWNRSSSYLVLLPCIIMLCFACAPQTINLPMIAGDSDLVIENLSTNITVMVSLMKTLTVWINGIPLKSLLRYMANDWDAVTNNIERETMVNTARITRKITIGSTLMVNIVILAFVPARLSSMKNNDITLFLRGYYPYNTSISPNFELTMIGQYVAAIYAANTYTTVDTLVVLLIFHVCGQLSILRQDLGKIDSYDKKNIEMKMQKIVEKHEYINRFAGRIENSFNMMLLFQMLSCTIQICSQFYQVMMSLGENTMEDMIFQISFLLIYVFYVMLQLFLYCYMGEKLAAESTEIANIAYGTKWYNLPPKNARWLVIIMCRATSSPLQITAGRFCSFTFALYCQSANLFFIWGNLELVTENLSTANIPGINAMIKLIFAWYYKDSFKPIMKSFYDDWRSAKTEEEKTAMLKMAKPANFISVWCSILTLTMVTAYLSLRSINVYLSDRLHENQDHLSLYPGYFPYNIRPVPILLMTNFAQVIAGYSATICYTTVDTFIAMLVLHICGQFEILRKKLTRLMGGEEGNRSIDEFQKELVWIITKHEHLNWLAQTIEKCFSPLLLLQMLLCTIEICFQGFLFFNVLIKNENGIFNFQLVFFVLFVCFILVHVYLYCYIGEMLLIQSREMSNSAYESNWYNVSPSQTKCLLFIMNRSTRPLCLTAGKFGIFSMELFSTILKTAMGYLSVLLTVANND
ncbi:odorant receptor 4-like [Bombus bifarius]|uniref:Odorant receptor 4-like n=1 Tax=Bombus bifarius TaxID=103933 RepID=A0A6P8LX62_9HYME|nr:odorant receptor 4-like [Bombus bifarius]